MTNTANRSTYSLDIETGLRDNLKASAASQGKTMREWVIEAIIAKLEDEIDAAAGLASLADDEGTMSLEDYLKSRKKTVEDYSLREDTSDLALIRKRRGEPSRPFRDYLAERNKKGK